MRARGGECPVNEEEFAGGDDQQEGAEVVNEEEERPLREIDSPSLVSQVRDFTEPALEQVSNAVRVVQLVVASSTFGKAVASFVGDTLGQTQKAVEYKDVQDKDIQDAEEGKSHVLTPPDLDAEAENQDRTLSTSNQDSSATPYGGFTWARWLPNIWGLKYVWRFAYSCMSFVHKRLIRPPHTHVQSLIARVQTTLRGSGDDIGWIQKETNLPPVEDGTERFNNHINRILNGVHTLPDSLVYLLIPGLFSRLGNLYFVNTKKHLSQLGLTCHIAKIHSEAAVEKNAQEIRAYVDELYWATGKRVMLLGHSKGSVDSAAAVAMYPELRHKVAGIIFVQSPYAGSPVASDILRPGQIGDLQSRQILEMIFSKVIKGDLGSITDITYEKRREFLEKYPMPAGIPMVSFHSEASKAPAVLSTLSHVTHAEIPWASKPSLGGDDVGEIPSPAKVPVAMPLAAAMAVCALHLELRYGEKSDGLVARKDAEVPGSIVVRPDKKYDHGWMVYSPAKPDTKEANAAQICEALMCLLLEKWPLSSDRRDQGEASLPQDALAATTAQDSNTTRGNSSS
eukprot:SM000077S21573  [mRNA]  locus=s77:248000:252063:- [translate_table: standard]